MRTPMNKTRRAIQALRDNGPYRIFTVCTGGGAGLQGDLWSIPGSSSFLVGSAFPYAKEATIDFLGFEPKKFCSEDAAIHLAMEAYKRAWTPDGAPAIGIGLTASVASTREHRGDHRIFVASVDRDECNLMSVVIPKGVGYGQRTLDGGLCDVLALNTLLHTVGQTPVWESGSGSEEDYLGSIPECTKVSDAKLQDLFFEHPYFTVDGRRHTKPPADHNHFPGAFNPPHEGHFGMASAVERFTGKRTLFNITADSPHKDPLSVPELLQRSKMLRGHPTLFTRGDPFYIDKAKQFPNTGFVIGTDALQRMFDPKWCNDIYALERDLYATGATFYVLGRVRDGVWVAPKKVCDDRTFAAYLQPISGRWDISSTEIRKAKEAK